MRHAGADVAETNRRSGIPNESWRLPLCYRVVANQAGPAPTVSECCLCFDCARVTSTRADFCKLLSAGNRSWVPPNSGRSVSEVAELVEPPAVGQPGLIFDSASRVIPDGENTKVAATGHRHGIIRTGALTNTERPGVVVTPAISVAGRFLQSADVISG